MRAPTVRAPTVRARPRPSAAPPPLPPSAPAAARSSPAARFRWRPQSSGRRGSLRGRGRPRRDAARLSAAASTSRFALTARPSGETI